MKTRYFFCFLLFPAVCGLAQANTAQEFLDKITAELLFTGDISMQIEVLEGETSYEKYMLFRRDTFDHALLLQQGPAAMNGIGYLFLSGELWLYNPVCRCFEISHKDRSKAGKYISFSDILPQVLADDFAAISMQDGELSGEQVVILECLNDGKTAARLFVSKKTGLPVLKEYISETGNITALVTIHSYGEYKKKYVPLSFSVKTADGVEVLIKCSDVTFHSLPDAVFTKSYLLEITR